MDFAATRWTLVLNAARRGEQARPALAELCRLYWQPLYAYVRRCGHDPHTAEDLTQEFFARLLAKDALARIAPEKGKFRSFLLAALKHFLANEWDRARARKRGGGAVHLSLDAEEAESRYQPSPPLAPAKAPDGLAAEHALDREWAQNVLGRALTQLRAQYAGKEVLFDALRPGLTGEAAPLAETAGKVGLSEGAVKVAAHRLRSRFARLLREEVAHTVASPGDVEEELRYLLSFL